MAMEGIEAGGFAEKTISYRKVSVHSLRRNQGSQPSIYFFVSDFV